MTFEEVIQSYTRLRAERQAGGLTEAQFASAVSALLVQDASGRWWSLDPGSGAWQYYDGAGWQRPPPGSPAAAAPRSASRLAGHATVATLLEQRGLEPPRLSHAAQVLYGLLSIAGGLLSALLWLLYSGLREGRDWGTAVLMVLLPLVLLALRAPLDRLLLVVQPVREQLPRLVLVALGLAAPYVVAFILYRLPLLHLTQYPYMRACMVVGTLVAYLVLRTPRAAAPRGGGGQRIAPGPVPPSRPQGRLPQVLLRTLLVLSPLLGAALAVADDFLRDPLNVRDGLRTPGWAWIIAGTATSLVSILVNLPQILQTLFPPVSSAAAVATPSPAAVGVTPVSPLLDGGPGENPFTAFSGGRGPGSCGVGVPNYWVSTATLRLVVQDSIFRCTGLGPPLELTLTYNPPSGAGGMFGRGWRLNYESRLSHSAETVEVWKGSGRRLTFRPGAPIGPQGPAGPVEAVSLEGTPERLLDYGDYWLFVEKSSRLRYRYDKQPGGADCRLTSLFDPAGNAVQLSYNADGTLGALTDAVGRVVRFACDAGGRCLTLTVPGGRSALFSYDAGGCLASAEDLQGIVSTYEYDAEGDLVRMVVGGRERVTTFAYQATVLGKCLAVVTDAAGRVTGYEVLSPEPCQVRVTDPEGRATIYHSSSGLTERVVDPVGHCWSCRYAGGLPVSIQDRNGQVTSLEYDARGNVTRLIDPLGHVTVLTYDPYDRPLSCTNAAGEAWRWEYLDPARLLRSVSPAGAMTTYGYDDRGQVSAITDANGNTRTFSHDQHGKLAACADALGNVTRLSYDQHGLTVTGVTDPRGHTTYLQFDANERLTRITHPDGAVRGHEYSCCAGLSTTDENGHLTCFVRDAVQSVTSLTSPLGHQDQFRYDGNGLLVGATDPLGRSLQYLRDDLGRLSRVVDPAGHTLAMGYDPAGHLTALVDQRGKQTVFAYDATGRPISITDALGRTTANSRDAVGRVTRELTARGQVIEHRYDAEGREVALSYDGVEAGAYQYDAIGNLTAVSDATGTTVFRYDAADRVVGLRHPDGSEFTLDYDAAGNLTGLNYPGDFRVSYGYDQRDRPTSVCWGDQSVTLTYDPVSNLVGQTRSNGTTTACLLDADYRLLEIRHERGTEVFARRVYTRDAAGNVTAESGRLPLPPSPDPDLLVFTCNDADQVTRAGGEDYAYDADGNLVEISGGRWQAAYDAASHLTALTRHGQTTLLSYNALGWRTRAVSGEHCRQFYHDPRGRLLLETDGAGEVAARYVYAGNLLLARVAADGTTRFYHSDKTGNTLALTDTQGQVTTAYSYAPFGAVTASEGEPLDNPFTYVGAFGVTDEGGGLFFMKRRYYDATARRFCQKDPIGLAGGTNLYAYAGGNPVTGIDPEGTELIMVLMAGVFLLGAGAAIYASARKAQSWGPRATRGVTDIVSHGRHPGEDTAKVLIRGYDRPAGLRTTWEGLEEAGSDLLTALTHNPAYSWGVSAWKAVGQLLSGQPTEAAWTGLGGIPGRPGEFGTTIGDVREACRAPVPAAAGRAGAGGPDPRVGTDELYR